MAQLCPCPTCGHGVSTAALACPACGHKLRESKSSQSLHALLWFLFIMLIGLPLLTVVLDAISLEMQSR